MNVQIIKSGKNLKIYSTNELFSEPVTRSIIDNKVVYKRAGIFDNKIYNFNFNGARYHSTLPFTINEGVYKIEEGESNEDTVVIYLN